MSTSVQTMVAPHSLSPAQEPARGIAAGYPYPPSKKAARASFDPTRDLIANGADVEVVKMKDIGFAEDVGISPVAVSSPFQLFSEDAIDRMREEILQPAVLEKCRYTSDLAPCQLRGYCPQYAKFVYDAWTHPETLKVVSEVAKVPLVPAMEFEIGHVNLQIKSDNTMKEELAVISGRQDGENKLGDADKEDDKPIVGWHTDSYPFVCVLMLSDCTGMVGGETALFTGYGDVLKVRGPQKGCAVVLQGRYITHQALRALGSQERITMVTSFRPRSPFLADDTVLKTVRPISDLNELYSAFGAYRLNILKERVDARLSTLRQWYNDGKHIDTVGLKEFFKDQIAFLEATDREIVEEKKVRYGKIDRN